MSNKPTETNAEEFPKNIIMASIIQSPKKCAIIDTKINKIYESGNNEQDQIPKDGIFTIEDFQSARFQELIKDIKNNIQITNSTLPNNFLSFWNRSEKDDVLTFNSITKKYTSDLNDLKQLLDYIINKCTLTNHLSNSVGPFIPIESFIEFSYLYKSYQGINNNENLKDNLVYKNDPGISRKITDKYYQFANNKVTYWRRTKGDGNCFYRVIIFRIIEIYILTNNMRQLIRIYIDLYRFYNDPNNFKYFKITDNITISPELNLKIFLLIIMEMQTNQHGIAYQVFVKSMNESKSFDFGLVLFYRYLLKKYITENEEKLFLPEFPVKIGNLLPVEYENNGNFLYSKFYDNFLMKTFKDAEKIVIYLTPFIFNIRLNIFLFEEESKNFLKTCKYGDDNTQIQISVIYKNNHYDLAYFQTEMNFYNQQFQPYLLKDFYNNKVLLNENLISSQIATSVRIDKLESQRKNQQKNADEEEDEEEEDEEDEDEEEEEEEGENEEEEEDESAIEESKDNKENKQVEEKKSIQTEKTKKSGTVKEEIITNTIVSEQNKSNISDKNSVGNQSKEIPVQTPKSSLANSVKAPNQPNESPKLTPIKLIESPNKDECQKISEAEIEIQNKDKEDKEDDQETKNKFKKVVNISSIYFDSPFNSISTSNPQKNNKTLQPLEQIDEIPKKNPFKKINTNNEDNIDTTIKPETNELDGKKSPKSPRTPKSKQELKKSMVKNLCDNIRKENFQGHIIEYSKTNFGKVSMAPKMMGNFKNTKSILFQQDFTKSAILRNSMIKMSMKDYCSNTCCVCNISFDENILKYALCSNCLLERIVEFLTDKYKSILKGNQSVITKLKGKSFSSEYLNKIINKELSKEVKLNGVSTNVNDLLSEYNELTLTCNVNEGNISRQLDLLSLLNEVKNGICVYCTKNLPQDKMEKKLFTLSCGCNFCSLKCMMLYYKVYFTDNVSKLVCPCGDILNGKDKNSLLNELNVCAICGKHQKKDPSQFFYIEVKEFKFNHYLCKNCYYTIKYKKYYEGELGFKCRICQIVHKSYSKKEYSCSPV